MKNLKPVLLIEDDQVDAMTVKRAFKDVEIENELVHVTNGEQGIAYLENKSNVKPCIILLDLNMPKMNGHEFLRIIKQKSILRSIPVVILTTSSEEKDKTQSFESSVAGYLIKPMDYDKFVQLMKTLKEYWTSNELP